MRTDPREQLGADMFHVKHVQYCEPLVEAHGGCYIAGVQRVLKDRMRRLAEANQLRPDIDTHLQAAQEAATRLGLPLLDAASNDYLGFANEPAMPSAGPWGAGASRLIFGTHPAHERLERSIAGWLGDEAALLFASGYAANVGAIQALAGPGDVIVSDELNHASIIDGCRLSKARVITYPHLDTRAAERALAESCQGTRWLITETIFSMDGDSPDLAALRAAATAAGAALYVDEAHAVGVIGPSGRGLCEQADVQPDVRVVTFGKAFGAQGACVAGSAVLRQWLFNRARSFVYSTGPSPVLTELLGQRVDQVRAAQDGRARLRSVVERFRQKTKGVFQDNRTVPSPIFPVTLGSEGRALEAARRFRERGILVQAIRPPTVAPGTARIRVTLKATFDDDAIARLAAATRDICSAS